MDALAINFQEGDLPSLHPHEMMVHLRGICIAKSLFEGLTRIDENGKIRLSGAEAVDISMDKLHYEFTLRENRWSDGTPVIAAHYADAIKEALSPDSPCSRADLLYMIKNAEKVKKRELPVDALGIKAKDDKTLIIDLEYPCSCLLDLLAQCICAPMIDPKCRTPTVFNGPFCLASWEKNNLMTLKPNPYFWNQKKVGMKKIDIYMMSDPSTVFDAYEDGQINWIGLPLCALTLEQLQVLQKKDAIYSQPVNRSLWVHLNTQHPVLSCRPIRQALSMALDREAITRYILLGGAPLQRALTESFLQVKIRPSLLLKEDIKDAQMKFEEGLFELGLSKADFPPLTIAYSQQAGRKQVAEYLQETWKKVFGIDVRLEQREWNVLRSDFTKGEFEIAATYQGSQYNDPLDVLERFGIAKPSNFSQWTHSGYRNLISMAKAERDSHQSSEVLAKAEEILLEEMPMIPLCSDRYLYSHPPGLKKYVLNTGGSVDFSYAVWE